MITIHYKQIMLEIVKNNKIKINSPFILKIIIIIIIKTAKEEAGEMAR